VDRAVDYDPGFECLCELIVAQVDLPRQYICRTGAFREKCNVDRTGRVAILVSQIDIVQKREKSPI
jgi:hypothetical protein